VAEYIEREELVEWIKRIPLKDLSDGLGLCRVIMEEDFKRAIRTIPAGTLIDVAPVVRCKDCKYLVDAVVNANGFLICDINDMEIKPEDFCSYGERRGGGEDG
jgi:hypothetical protein